jgi:hypothetical protein
MLYLKMIESRLNFVGCLLPSLHTVNEEFDYNTLFWLENLE